MSAKNLTEAIKIISECELYLYSEFLSVTGILCADDVKVAADDYRQFMLLWWLNNSTHEGKTIEIAPTRPAYKIWQEHIMDRNQYDKFCEKLVGELIMFRPATASSCEYVRFFTNTQFLQHWSNLTPVFSKAYCIKLPLKEDVKLIA